MDWMLMNQKAIAQVKAWAAENSYPEPSPQSPHYRLTASYVLFFVNYEVSYWPQGAVEAIATLKFSSSPWDS